MGQGVEDEVSGRPGPRQQPGDQDRERQGEHHRPARHRQAGEQGLGFGGLQHQAKASAKRARRALRSVLPMALRGRASIRNTFLGVL